MLFARFTIYCYLLLWSPVRSKGSEGNSFLDEYFTWFTYYFKWSDKFTNFNSEICHIRQQTYFFGGARLSKWVLGKYTIRAYSTIKKNLKNKFVHPDELTTDAMGRFTNLGALKHEHDQFLPLMVGRDYFEPCTYKDKAPKMLTYKLGAPTDKPFNRGAFDVFVGRGTHDCGEGRFGDPPEDTGSPEYIDWEKHHEHMKNNLGEFEFPFQPNSEENPPIESFNSGGLFSGDPGDKVSKGNRFFTSAVFDPSLETQVVCLIFWCTNRNAACSVVVENFVVGDIAGYVDEMPNTVGGTPFTPMDLLSLFGIIFSLVFFCIQCCCCCQMCAHELRGGVVDEAAVAEGIMKQKYLQNQQNNPQKRGGNRRGSPRHAKRKSRSPNRRSPRAKKINLNVRSKRAV